MGTTANLLYGTPSYIKIGTYGATEADCVDVGFTDAAVELIPKFEIEKRLVAQNLGAVDANMKGVSFSLKMTLAEPSMANLKMALSLPDANLSGSVLSIGSGLGIQKKTIYLQGPGPSGGTRHIKIQKCYLSEPGPYSMDKKSTNLAMTFELLEDTTVVDEKQRWLIITDGSGDTTAPTISSTTPVDDATGVAVGANLQVIFSEAINGSDVSPIYFKVVKASDGTGVPGALSLSSDKTTVTFDPTSDLAAATAYIFIISQGIRDLAGNKLAADTYVNFTTA